MKHTLRFAADDKKTFDAVRKGAKSIETRAATDRYRKIKTGDILVLVCAGKRLEKKVLRVRHFKTIEGLFRAIPIKKIDPFASSIQDARKTYHGYPGYRDKIRKFGIMAFDLN